ncbi:hypothetical protein E5288_WYG020170 [Bos mutus]|uniref:Uncharacterized protein n=1 Tax=Bos mutus TaxID=72004 RepID=A0A6B0S434_9CETA|nr:hypothetical protein [Bos mutus]
MLRRVARDLADAQAVLSSLPSPELFPGVGQTLELLAAAGRDVAACHLWIFSHPLNSLPLGRSMLFKESQDCLEASVMFNLLRLLTRDLKCVASGDQCV